MLLRIRRLLRRLKQQRQVIPLVGIDKAHKGQQTDIICYDDRIQRKAFEISALESTAHLPKSIYCPITRMPMQDPVIAADGYSYERAELLRWTSKNKTSPVTGGALDDFIMPNHNLRSTIEELILN